MRTTFRTLSAAFLAALFALASCDKSDIAVGGGVQQQTGGSRVIAVSFQNNTTKTKLDGLQPKFVATDVIKVSNGTATEECTVSIDGSGNASITTELTGTLTMVYPATAAKMSGNAIDGVLVPTEQDGTFASANICMAENIAEGATSATFENQTAVFKLFVPENADAKGADYTLKSVTIISIGGNNIADGSKKITVGNGTASVADADGYCYVSLLPGETIKNLDVSAGAGLRTLSGEAVLSTNSLYSVALPVLNGYEYVEIAGMKWATMNVGATTVAGSASTCYGEYFAWGETTGHKVNYATEETADGHSFDWTTAPFNNGSSSYDSDYFNTNKSTWLTDNVLKPACDAATANWGSSWRMPTHEEFQALYSACTDESEGAEPTNPLPETITDGGVYWSDSYNGVAGMLFVDKSDISKRVFFPAAGGVFGTSFYNGGSIGFYWSSSLYTVHPNYAYYLYFSDWSVDPSDYYYYRYSGFTVRPFSE